MKIYALSENTTSSKKFGCEHGLSLYIETMRHKILFDTGASGLFALNSEKLSIDLSNVDMVFISHGHYDHGGGLKTFFDINKKAKVYLHNDAFGKYYSVKQDGKKKYIGLDRTLTRERFVFCRDNTVIDEELELFSHVRSARLIPSGNSNLFMETEDGFAPDNFTHEQNLIIKQNGKTLLLAGCAHNGIVNIVDCFHTLKGTFPDTVIGGFHLYSSGKKTNEDPKTVVKIANILLDTHAQFYTCHCTGPEAYMQLKSIMGEKIKYLSTGNEIII